MRGVVTITLWSLNLFFWGTLFVLTILFRLIPGSRAAVTGMLQRILEIWARGHRRISDVLLEVEWEIRGGDGLTPGRNYLIIANHRSWLDIPIVEDVLIGRTSFIRFFAKRELRWVPIIGAALWALEMPMVRRISKEVAERNPEMRHYDLVTTRRACAHFGLRRAESLLSFIEGTRITPEKHAQQDSPYAKLLRPKLGGISLVLAAIGDRLTSLVDVTIIYPPGDGPVFWRMANGEIDRVVFDIVERPIPPELVTPSLLDDEKLRARFRGWIEQIWREKDEKLNDER